MNSLLAYPFKAKIGKNAVVIIAAFAIVNKRPESKMITACAKSFVTAGISARWSLLPDYPQESVRCLHLRILYKLVPQP